MNPQYYWRRVSIGDHQDMAARLHTFAKDHVDLESCKFWNNLDLAALEASVPALFTGVESLGTHIKHAALLVLRIDESTLHTDHTKGTQQGVQARLNVPILNCHGSRTAFFEMSPQQEKLKHVVARNGTQFWNHRELYTPVTEIELDQPTILRTSAPHTVFCTANAFPRLAITVTFSRDAVNWLDDCNN